MGPVCWDNIQKYEALMYTIEEVPVGDKKPSPLAAAAEESVNPKLHDLSHPKCSTPKHAAGMSCCPTDPVLFINPSE